MTCLECQAVSHKFDSFMYLSVPVKNTNKIVNIESCIEEFTKEEILEKDDRW